MINDAKEFLEYVAKNEKSLKKNLRKNITYDAELFDDVFANAIIKVYNNIVNNNVHIDDMERYFFIASKFEYINTDNKNRKQKSNTDDIELYKDAEKLVDTEYDDTKDIIYNKYKSLINYINETYGHNKAEIFLTYFTYKADHKKVSYKKIADEFDMEPTEVSSIINEIKNDNHLYKYKI